MKIRWSTKLTAAENRIILEAFCSSCPESFIVNVERVSVSVDLKRLEDARTRELNEISEGFIATK